MEADKLSYNAIVVCHSVLLSQFYLNFHRLLYMSYAMVRASTGSVLIRIRAKRNWCEFSKL